MPQSEGSRTRNALVIERGAKLRFAAADAT